MVFDEDDCLPLSGIQHLAFCPRQFALIHIERVWVENVLTYEGRVIHERADDPFYIESRGTVLITRSMPLLSRSLGLYGVADVVEFHLRAEDGVTLAGRNGVWQPFPVEYKRGRVKTDDCDLVQLCAQAMCIEEMLNVPVGEGAMFYGKTRRRLPVQFDAALRDRVTQLASLMHALYDAGKTPPPTKTKACKRCSLVGICLPGISHGKNVKRYLRAMAQSRCEGGEPR